MRILLVDDNEMNRRVISHILESAGVAVEEAEDARCGLALLDRQPYDIVLMDLRMPHMDGLAAVAEIRARADGKAQTPVIIITADNAADIREHCMRAGADECLKKPVGVETLFDAISMVTLTRDAGGALVL